MSLPDLLAFIPLVRDRQLRGAVFANDLPRVRRLLRHGANPNAPVHGCSLLVNAVHCADHQVIGALTAGGADLKRDGAFALYAAATGGLVATVEVLLQAGVDPNAPLPDGQMVLEWAMIPAVCEPAPPGPDHSLQRRAAVIGALLKGGADPNLGSEQGRVLMCALGWEVVALEQGAPTRVPELLLKHGADPNHTLPGGQTPLISFAPMGEPELLLPLLKYGAEVNRQDQQGLTALWQAVSCGCISNIRLLLAHGADPNLCAWDGSSPLLLAVEFDHAGTAAEMVALLCEAGADVNRANRGGWTPLASARDLRRSRVVEILTESGATDFP